MMAKDNGNGERRVIWDGRVNIPTVLMVVTLLFSGWKFASDLGHEAKTATQGLVEFKTDMTEIKASLKSLELAAAKTDGHSAILADHEARIRALEGR